MKNALQIQNARSHAAKMLRAVHRVRSGNVALAESGDLVVQGRAVFAAADHLAAVPQLDAIARVLSTAANPPA